MTPGGTASLRLLLCTSLLLGAVAGRDAAAAGRRQDLVAHGSQDRFWIADVSAGAGKDGAQVRTDVYARSVGETRWQPVTTVESRVVSMAHRGPQLALLLDDGTWLLASEEALVTGRPPPVGAQILDIAPHGQTLAALARVRSGGSHRLILLTLGQAGWAQQAELGSAVADAWADASLAVVESSVLVAVRQGDGAGARVRLVRRAGEGAWEEAGSIALRPDAVAFELIGGGPVPVLWVLGRDGGYGLHWFGGEGVQSLDVPPPRGVESSEMAAAYAFERVRVLYAAAGKRYERTYDPMPAVTAPADGSGTTPATGPTTSGAAATAPTSLPAVQDTRIVLPGRPVLPWVTKWTQPLLSLALLFTIIASLRRRSEMQQAMLRAGELPLAPWGRRLAAGCVDALPLLIGLGALWARSRLTDDPAEVWADPAVQAAVLAGPVIYILHTTVTEALFGRSVGKMIFRLRVVALDGSRPTTGALLARNLLRVVDLLIVFFPLVLVLFSPLRQRAGDVAAGTLVVRADVPVELEEVGAEEKAEEPVETK